jgi:excisionase family DNA binding protein
LVASVSERLLDAGEIAELLHVPESWVRQQARENRIPHLRLGRYIRFEEEAVVAWLEDQRAGTWRKHDPRISRRTRAATIESDERSDGAPGGGR